MKATIWKILLPIRLLLSFFYALGFWINSKRIKPKKIEGLKIISVGNITSGGTGKTPFVAYLATLLQNKYRITPAILMRGYKGPMENNAKRNNHNNENISSFNIIDLTGKWPAYSLGKRNPGDEALLYSYLNIKAVLGIGKNRFENGSKIKELGIDWAILDDGMQHHYLYRDFELVLLDSTDPDGGGLIPLGKRREFLRSLQKASAIIFSKWNQATDEQKKFIKNLTNKWASEIPHFLAGHVPKTPYCLVKIQGKKDPKINWENETISALCGIGNPGSFLKTLKEELKVNIKEFYIFPDHYDFSKEDMQKILSKAQNQVIMTEKDAVRVQALFQNKIPYSIGKNLWVLPITWKFLEDDEKKFIGLMDTIVT